MNRTIRSFFALISLVLTASAATISSQFARAQSANRDQAPGAGDQDNAVISQFPACGQSTSTIVVKRNTARLPPPAMVPVRPNTQRLTPNASLTGSTSVTVTQTSISLLYLADGTGKGATALAVPLYVIPGTANRLKLCGIGAVGLGGGTQIYMGTAVSYLLYSSKTGWSATAFAGWKGVSLTNGQLPSGTGNAVLGIGISIPVRSL